MAILLPWSALALPGFRRAETATPGAFAFLGEGFMLLVP
jgi:hypothetical protein